MTFLGHVVDQMINIKKAVKVIITQSNKSYLVEKCEVDVNESKSTTAVGGTTNLSIKINDCLKGLQRGKKNNSGEQIVFIFASLINKALVTLKKTTM